MSTKDRVMELAASGMIASEIAREVGVTRQRVSQIIKKHGVPIIRGNVHPDAPSRALRAGINFWGKPFRVSTCWTGAGAELMVAVDLIARGFYVYHSVARSGPFDLAAFKDGKFYRVEVKCDRSGNLKVRPDDRSDILAYVRPTGEIKYTPEP